MLIPGLIPTPNPTNRMSYAGSGSRLKMRIDRTAVATLSGLCCFLSIAVAQMANASPETDREVSRVAQIYSIPEADAEFFAARIAAVEKSPNAVLTFETMSAWRRNRLLRLIEDWAKEFPIPEDRTQATTRGHSWYIMQSIAGLFVHPPMLASPEEAAAIDLQMAEIREIIVETLFPKVRNFISNAVQSSAAASAFLTAEEIDSLTTTVSDNLLIGMTLQKDEDLEPFGKHRIAPSAFAETKQRMRAAAEAAVVEPRFPIYEESFESLVSTLRAARTAGDDTEAQRHWRFTTDSFTMNMSSSIESVLDIAQQAFSEACPATVLDVFDKYDEKRAAMIDTAAMKAGDKELSAIRKANMERRAAESRRDFEAVIARSPQAQEQLRSKKKADHPRWIYLLVNAALVAILAFIMWMRRRTRLAQEAKP